MMKRNNRQLLSHREKVRAHRDNPQRLSFDDFIMRDIGIARHEILARLAK